MRVVVCARFLGAGSGGLRCVGSTGSVELMFDWRRLKKSVTVVILNLLGFMFIVCVSVFLVVALRLWRLLLGCFRWK